MSDPARTGEANLRPWKPGESGNPDGSSRRSRARTAARKIGGLKSALRGLLDERCPEDLLASLSAEQRAAMDGEPTLGRFLAARLLTVAATARSIDDFLAALTLVASVDVRTEIVEPATELDGVIATLPHYLRWPLKKALDAHRDGGDPAWAFDAHLRFHFDEAQKERLYRTAVGDLEVATSREDFEARLARLSHEDIEHLDRITTALRVQPIEDQIEREISG